MTAGQKRNCRRADNDTKRVANRGGRRKIDELPVLVGKRDFGFSG